MTSAQVFVFIMKMKIEIRVSSGIARPLGLHFNHYVSLSVRPSDQIILPLACVTAIFDWQGLLSIISPDCGQLVKVLINPKLHGIFDYLYIF